MRLHYLSLLLVCVACPAAVAAECVATSGSERRPVVELFTSEGCDSCPPADRWLSALRANGSAPARMTALAYHVDYWDYIGWKDRFALPKHGDRHQRMVARSGGRVRYTPQVFVNGLEYSAWRDGREPREAAPTALMMAASSQGESAHRWRIFVRGKQAPSGPLTLTIALTEDELASRVTAGENRGEHLRHDFVVREVRDYELSGPEFAFDAALELPKDADPRRARASLVLRGARGDLLQSLSLALCQ